MKNKFKLIVLGVLSLFLTGCSDYEMRKTIELFDYVVEYATDYSNIKEYDEDLLDTGILELVEQIEISEGYEEEYNRDEYTSSSQSYEVEDRSYDSIRTFSYYESEHYIDEEYVCPYDSEVYELKELDFDHIIPLHYVNKHGGESWDETKKKEFADDPTIGVNVNASDNRSKSDKGPSEWLPEENLEDYCYTWLIITVAWDLTITQDDLDTILYVLEGYDFDDLTLINEY